MNPSGSSNLCAQNLRSLKGLCTLLILLLIANSSQALETLAHDGHSHDGHSHDNIVAMGFAVDVPVSEATHNQHMDQNADGSHEAQNDECFCDEICCVSSVGFVAPLTAGVSPQTSSLNERLFGHYQSVSLDLLLPPPTH